MTRMRKLFARAMLCAVLVTACASARAQQLPGELVESTVQAVLEEVTARRGEFEKDNAKLYAMVERLVVPIFDVPRIAKLVMAANWRKAGKEQRAAFAEEFKRLMISSYASALFSYTGKERVEFTGVTISERKNRKLAEVTSEVLLGDGVTEPVPVEYFLLLGKDGKWRIYNLKIADLDMVVHYRSTYANLIQSRGLDELIAEMKAGNDEQYQ